jgi:hypothetical protein
MMPRSTTPIDLEALRVRLEPNIPNFGPGRGVDNRQLTCAISDDHALAGSVDAHIVGVITQVDAPDWRQILAAQHRNRARSSIRHI